MAKDLLSVNVYFPIFMKKRNFSGKAFSVSSKNEMGDFDILPYHSNFITLIFDEVIIRTPDNEEVEYDFKRGVLKVSSNEVKIFLGI